MERQKITIVGAGRVGSSTALWCTLKELGDIVLWNRTQKTAKGLALDLMETNPILNSDIKIIGTNDFKKTKNSDIIVITAGAQRKKGMSRDDLLNLNGKIIKDITKKITRYNKNSILIIVSNPLDAMTYIAKKYSKYSRKRIMGMAGILDSSRFRSFIANKLNVSVEDVNALVLGGHGDSMLPLPRHASVNGVPLIELMKKTTINKLIKRTRQAGAEIIKLEQSSAFYSPSASVTEMIESIIKDKKRVLPCAAYLNGEYGVKGIFMGVPVILGSNGIEKIIELKLNKQEKKSFLKSANHIKKLISNLSI